MATDYDAPRKTDDDSESIEALKERVPDKMSGAVDVEDADNPSASSCPAPTSPTWSWTSSCCPRRKTSSPASSASS